jgi:hypothetical protein
MSTWYAYTFAAVWLIILACYLSNAFERIVQLEKRVDDLEGKNKNDE